MMAVPSVEVQQVVVDASGKVVVAFDTVLPPADDSIYMYQCQTGQENGHLASSRYPVFAKPASVDLPLISSFFFFCHRMGRAHRRRRWREETKAYPFFSA